MKYAKKLRKQFPSLILIPEDLFHLEGFQIKYLPSRVPQKEFSALLHSNPVIKQFLISKFPPIKGFIDTILEEHRPVIDLILNEKYSQELLWEIADLIIYNKYPEVFDSHVNFNWNINEILPAKSLEGKIVADIGAGSGKLTFLVAKYAKTVFAIEPIGSFRNYIMEKVKKEDCKNIYVMDGFLDSIPLPDNSVDILMTSNAIGWNLEDELFELERVIKVGGHAIHLLRNQDSETHFPFHNILISENWNYKFIDLEIEEGIKAKYSKVVTK